MGMTYVYLLEVTQDKTGPSIAEQEKEKEPKEGGEKQE